MNEFGAEFFSNARFARDQYARIGWGDFFDLRAQRLRRAARADPVRDGEAVGAQRLVLAFQLGRFNCTGHQVQQAVSFKRLFDEVVRAAPDRGDRGFDIAVPTDDNHWQKRVNRLEIFQHRQAVHIAALQPDIQNNKARCATAHFLDRALCRRRDANAMAIIFEDARNQFTNVRFVIND